MKPGEVVSNAKPGSGPVRSVARSVAPRRGARLAVALRIRAVRIRHINDTSIKNRRCTGTGRTRPRQRTSRGAAGRPGPRGPGPPREPEDRVPYRARLGGLALPERVYTQATPACQLSTIVLKTSTTNLLRRAAPTAHFVSKPGSQSRSPGREPKRARSRACLTLLW